MSQGQIVGLVGAALLIIGAFLPILSLPTGDVTYFKNGEGDGVFLLIFGVIALIFSLSNYLLILYAMGGLSLLLVGYDLVNSWQKINHMKSQMDAELEGNPFRGFADLAMESVQLQWGWAVMILGGVLVLFAPSLETKKGQNY